MAYQKNQQKSPLDLKPIDFDDDSMDVIEPEGYSSDKFRVFSHQMLVMRSFYNCIAAGNHEMRAGWFNTTLDNQGNAKKVYIEDTRAKFIETIKTAVDIMVCDFDADCKKNIPAILAKLKAYKEDLIDKQEKWFQSLPPVSKQNVTDRYGHITPGMFNTELNWYQIYMEFEIDCYREILRELSQLTRRLGFYEAEEFEG